MYDIDDALSKSFYWKNFIKIVCNLILQTTNRLFSDHHCQTTLFIGTGLGTLLGGEFDWGGRLLKSNGGAQWFTCDGWKSSWTCIRISEPDCETYKSSREETR